MNRDGAGGRDGGSCYCVWVSGAKIFVPDLLMAGSRSKRATCVIRYNTAVGVDLSAYPWRLARWMVLA